MMVLTSKFSNVSTANLNTASNTNFPKNSLENPIKDRQRFVDVIVLTSAPDWSKTFLQLRKRCADAIRIGLQTSNDDGFWKTESRGIYNSWSLRNAVFTSCLCQSYNPGQE